MFGKICITLIAALAAVGQASHHHKYAHLHRRQMNFTSSADPTAASSSSADAYSTTDISAPMTTGSPLSSTEAATSGYTTSMVVSNSTLTYTLGSGSSTTVVTTTVQFTSTETLYSVCLPSRSNRFLIQLTLLPS